MLCDYAQVEGNKLFVSGAGINLVGTSSPVPPYPVQISIAMLVTVPWSATDQDHQLTIELLSDPGTGAERVPLGPLPEGGDLANAGMLFADFNVGRSPQMKPGDTTLLPLAVPMMGLPLPAAGDYFFAVKVDGEENARMSFRLLVTQQPAPSGGSGPTAW